MKLRSRVMAYFAYLAIDGRAGDLTHAVAYQRLGLGGHRPLPPSHGGAPPFGHLLGYHAYRLTPSHFFFSSTLILSADLQYL